MIEVAILGAGLWGPGLPGWQASLPVLRGEAPWGLADTPPPAPPILSATERRRTGLAVRLALAAAADASGEARIAPGACRSVFATSNGDGAVIHAILENLAGPEPVVSPTQFHNSVHNVAAGYWSIGTGSRQPANCLGCHDASFGAALLVAAAEAATERVPVLLCVHDAPMPFPLSERRRTAHPFACGLILAPEGGPRLSVAYRAAPAPGTAPASGTADEIVAALSGNPAAQGIPMLRALARREGGSFALPYLDGQIAAELRFL